jgi:N-acetylglucosamine malate deacetylase 1
MVDGLKKPSFLRSIIQKTTDLEPHDKVYALAFGAHPDDVELSCGATLLKIMDEERRVAVCDLTCGEMGTLGNAETRRVEALEAKKVMGYVSRDILDLGDSELYYSRENLHAIIRIVRKYRPDVVFCNPPDERHPDHMKASTLVRDACFYAGLRRIETSLDGTIQAHHRPRHLFHFIQFRQSEPDIVVDVSSTFERSRQGVLAFGSQFHRDDKSGEPLTMINRKEFLTGLEARARSLGERIGTRYGEGFLVAGTLGVHHFSGMFPPEPGHLS